MAPALARSASLRQHLAFEQWRRDKQSVALGGELLSMLYTSYLLVADDVTDEGLEVMVAAEALLRQQAIEVSSGGRASPQQEDDTVLYAILSEHDRLLRVTPRHVFLAAKLRLHTLFDDGQVLSLAAVLAARCDDS